MNVHDTLLKVREIVEERWEPDRIGRLGRLGGAVCLLGAVSDLRGYVEDVEHGDLAYPAGEDPVVQALLGGIPKTQRLRQCSVIDQIVHYNDVEGRRKSTILRVIDRAIANTEENA